MSTPHPGPAAPERQSLLLRALPWVDLAAKLLTVVAATVAIWRGLH